MFIEFTIKGSRATGYEWTYVLNLNIQVDIEVSNYSNKEDIMLVNEYAIFCPHAHWQYELS